MYPSLVKNYNIHYSGEIAMIYEVNGTSSSFISELELYIFQHINGRNSYEDIRKIIMNDYNLSDAKQVDKTLNHFFMNHESLIDFNDNPVNNQMSFTGEYGKIIPLNLSIELTNSCNLNCIHCMKCSDRTKKDFIDYDLLIKGLEYLKSHVNSIQISGGEPMLHPQFNKIVSYCKKHFNSVNVSTSGTLINEMNIKYLVGTDVSVSLYSHLEEIHDDFTRVSGSYKKTMNGIKRLIEENINVSVSSIVTKDNLPYLCTIIEVCASIGVSSIRFGPIQPLGRALNLKENFFIGEKEEIRLNEITSQYQVMYEDKMDVVVYPLQSEAVLMSNGELSCGAGRHIWTITEKGNILPCYFFPVKNCTIGNIFENDVTDIVENICLSHIPSRLVSWNNTLLENGHNIVQICDQLSQIF